MTPFYLDCCKELNWPIDQVLVNKMKAENEKKLKVLCSFYLFFHNSIIVIFKNYFFRI